MGASEIVPSWLPDLILFKDFNGNWDVYLEALYERFQRDFGGAGLEFQGRRVALKRHPIIKRKEATFWHFISEGSAEMDRVPDFRRCERIGWPRAIIDNCADATLKIWTEEVKNDARIQVWCEDAEYLFVLADRNKFVLPWTAYPVVREHQKRKLQNRWERCQK